MCWPLGYGLLSLRFHASLGEVILANDVPVIGSGGRPDLDVPNDVRTLDGPDEYSLRIRPSVVAAQPTSTRPGADDAWDHRVRDARAIGE